jgi:two-component system, NarL family, nitrate/nitrite response regulator NarL
MREAIRLALVDDHQIVIDGIRSILRGQKEFELVAYTTNPKEIRNILTQHKIDILLTDVMMPEMNGYDLAKEVRLEFPGVKILALSMSNEAELIQNMIHEAGISGYVLKNIGRQELSQAILTIAEGNHYFDEAVLEELEKNKVVKKETTDTTLSAREIEIIKLIENELSNKEIADDLNISERTVETHRKNIFKKTKTSSVIGLIKYAYEHKLIK